VGSSIEKNTMRFPEGEHRFIVFGIRNLDTGDYLNVKVSRIPPTLHATNPPVQLSLIFNDEDSFLSP